MIKQLQNTLREPNVQNEIDQKLPYLFQLAELQSQRAGKIGMEVGSLRERILIAFLIYKFGSVAVDTNIPITQSEIDVKLFDQPLSIKTKSGEGYGGIKLVWTVDRSKVTEFIRKYEPNCELLLSQIVWGKKKGGLFYVPLEAQLEVFKQLRAKYFKRPALGTNPRGVELSANALSKLINHPQASQLEIYWLRREVAFDPLQEWVQYWQRGIGDA